MKNIIDRLEWFMQLKGLNDNSLTVQAGLSVGLVGKSRKTRNGLHSDTIEKLLHTFPDLSGEWLIAGVGEALKVAPNIAPKVAPNSKNHDEIHAHEPEAHYRVDPNPMQLRVVTVNENNEELISLVAVKAAAGYLNGYGDPEYIENLPTIAMQGFKGGSHRAFEVKGSSMLPVHHPGSIAIGRYVESLSDIRDRRVYILVTRDGVVIKRVLNRIKEENKLILLSDNENKREFPNYPIDPEDILELWYWRASIIRESPEPGGIYNRVNDIQADLTMLRDEINQLKGKNNPRLNG